MYLGSCQLDASYLGGCKLDKIYLGVCEVLSGGPVLPAFQANVPNQSTGLMDDVAIGVGGLTELRDGSLWAEDFEGINREFLAQEVARSGGRVIRNLALWSEDLSQWGKNFSGTGLVAALTENYGEQGVWRAQFERGAGDETGDYSLLALPSILAPNDPSTAITIFIKSNTGSNQKFLFYDARISAVGNEYVATTEWRRISKNIGAGTSDRFAVSVGTRGGTVMAYSGGDQTLDLLIKYATIEKLSAPGEPPGEYVKTEATTAVKVSERYNGNTVTDNVVTEAPGADLPQLPRIVHAPEATNTFLNNYTPATQDIAGQSGTRTCWLEGAGSVTLTGGLTGVVTDGNPVTGDPAGVDVLCTVSGTPDFVMFEDNSAPTAPIPTGATPETRPACNMNFDAANHDDTEGTYLLDVEFGTNGQGIFSDFLRVISTNIRLNDGSNFADVAGAVDTPHKIGIVYGAGTMRLNVDGVWSVDTAYDGSLPDGVLDLFRTSAGMNDAGMIERYAGKDESIVDAWMAE